jgi:hypothetical protein
MTWNSLPSFFVESGTNDFEDKLLASVVHGIFSFFLIIDPNGMLGPTAQNFLCRTPIDPNFPTATYLCLTPPCHKAIDSSKGDLAISSLLHTANAAWHDQNPDIQNPKWFGASYHTSTPKCGSKFILGLTTAHTFADHILDSYDIIKSHNLFTATAPSQILGTW